MKYETKLLLFDISIFFGGIEEYNKVILVFASFIGIAMNYKLRIEVSDYIEEWTDTYLLIRARVRPSFLNIDNKILDQVAKLSNVLSRLFTFILIVMGNIIFFDKID